MKKLILGLFFLALTTLTNAQYSKEGHLGDTITATIHPDPGWEFVGWFENDQLISTDITLVYIIKGDGVITAQLRQIKYKIDFIVIPPGSATISGVGEYLPGETVDVEVDPGLLFKVKKIQDQAGNLYDSSFSITPDQDMTFTASLAPNSWLYIFGLLIASLLTFLKLRK
jgi:hypothetical protein